MQQTAVTVLLVLDEVSRRQPVGVTELARVMHTPKSTMQRSLRALEHAGWIRPSGRSSGGWVLTTKPIDIARRVTADSGLRDIARHSMQSLRDRTGESVHLAVREGADVVIVDVEESVQPVRIYWPVGTRSAMHATATGKALLAHLDADELADALRGGLAGYTESTITERTTLDAELETVRTRGYAIACGELRDDIASVAAPVLGRFGRPLASISVFMPIHRVPHDGGHLLGDLVHEAARSVGDRLAS